MLLEQADTLRTWLTNTLEPVCDADPAALAKYVMALLKKDKPVQDLKDFCLDQLDVFLQKETKPFVDKLFEAIESKCYMSKTVQSTDPATVAQSIQSTRQERNVQLPSTSDPAEPQPARKVIRKKISPPVKERTGDKEKPSSSREIVRRDRKDNSRSRSRERREKERAARRAGSGTGEKFVRHRDSQREKEREKRKTSPSRSRSPHEKRRHRDASPAAKRTRGQDSVAEKNGYPLSEVGYNTHQGVSSTSARAKKTRCRDYDEKGYCMRGDLCEFDHGPDPVVVEEGALPKMISNKSAKNPPPPSAPPPPLNFAVPPPGYPSATSAPVVNPPPPGVDGYGPATTNTASSEGYNPEAPGLSAPTPTAMPVPLPRFTHPPPPLSGIVGAPGRMSYPPPPYPRPPHLPPPSLTVTVGNIRPIGPRFNDDHANKRRVVGEGIYSRLGPQGNFRPNYDNKTLQVRKVPFHLNNISKLNEHFQQFGHINNIQTGFGNDPEAALITFASRAQAMNAYKSTQPILNNRFIKVFWHQPDQSQEEQTQAQDTAPPPPPSAPPKLIENQSDLQDDKKAVLYTSKGSLTKTVYNPNAIRQPNPNGEPSHTPDSHINAPNPAATQQYMNKRKDIALAKRKMKMLKDQQKAFLVLHRKKSELLTKQSEQLKMLAQQMAKAKTPETKKAIMKMFRSVDEAIKTVKDDLEEMGIKMKSLSHAAEAAAPRTKEQVEKEKLDVELELLSQKQSGGDVANMQSRLSGLKQELLTLALSGSTRRQSQSAEPVPVASSTPIAKARKQAAPETAAVDHRPRDIIIIGFNIDKRDDISEQLQKFGPVDDLEFDCKNKENCRALVLFKNRRDAEQVVSAGSSFMPDLELSVQWGAQAMVTNMDTSKDEALDIVPDQQRDPSHQLSAEQMLAAIDNQESGESDNGLSDEIDEDEINS